MKTVIYYFSGTGNSLSVAKKIAAALGNCDTVPIASFRNTQGVITNDAERIGIVCPVYFSGLPLMVAEFLGRIDYSYSGYTFAVVTFGGSGDGPALRQLDSLIVHGDRCGLDAGFSVKMPGNYILMYSSPAGKKQAELLASADREVEEIIPVIERCENRDIPRAILGRLLHSVAYPWFASHAHNKAQRFSVNNDCISCGTCVKVCPADNIELRQGRPFWKDCCEVCCGCIHLCPTGAIQAGPRTENRQRYRNPSVSLVELEGQNRKKP
jgi:ferredoxin